MNILKSLFIALVSAIALFGTARQQATKSKYPKP